MGIITQANRPLAVNTPLGTDKLLLVGFTGREAISQPFAFHLDLLAENATPVPFEKLVGQGISVRLTLPGGQQRFFHGLCSRVSQGGRDTTFTAYRMEVVPAFWLLTRTAGSRIFQRKTVPDILKILLEGFDVEYQLQGKYEPREYCVQYRETDFNFASRIMEEEGIFYYFKHVTGEHRLVLADTPQAHADVPVTNTLIFERLVGGNRPEDRVHAWEKFQELRAGKVTLWDHHFQLAHKHLEAFKVTQDTVQAGTVAHKLKLDVNGDLELFDWPGGYAERYDGIDKGGAEKAADLKKIFDDNQRTAGIRMQEEAMSALEVEGQSDCRQLTSGHKFTLTRHFNADGPYVLTSVEHVAALPANFRSGSSPGLLYQNRFTCIPLGLPYRPVRRTPKPVVPGSQTAVVVEPPGEEIFPDKFGRVKVQFHWDRDGKHDLDSSCWVRVAQFYAGKRWGAMFIPRAGHEVLVDFLEGDPDRPVIVGSLYNSENMPHYELPKFKTLSYIKTNSSPGSQGFNEIRFEDKKGKEQVFLHSEKRFDIRAKGSYFETNGADRHAQIGVRSDDKPGGNFEITVGGDHDLHVKGNHFEGIDKDWNQTVKGKAVFDYQDSHDLFVKAKSQYNAQEIVLEAKTKITLKVGGSFITLDASGVSIMGPIVKINSGGAPTPAVPGLINDPNDAAPADNGEPGDIDKVTGVEPPKLVRKPRVVPAQHGFTVTRLPNGDLQVGKGIIVRGDPAYQNAVINDLATMSETPSGQKLLSDLDSSPQPTTIQQPGTPFNPPNAVAWPGTPTNPNFIDATPKGQPVFDGAGNPVIDPATGTQAVGTGKGVPSTVEYDPSQWPDPSSKSKAPGDVILFHELQHSNHEERGTFDGTPRNDGFTTNEEFNAIGPENQYRDERGVPRRTNHGDL